jgi:acetyl esterase/lipase
LIGVAVFSSSCFAQSTNSATATNEAKIPDWAAIEPNIHYDHYDQTVLDVMWPKAEAKGKRPGAIMFHGGGWVRSNKETMMGNFCLPYLEQGFVVCNVEYRLAPVATAPAAVNDALAAAKWFFDHADQYHVDTNRLVVTGASAGGHLALMVGMTPESAKLGPAVKVAAIVNGYGITDVADVLEGPHRQSWAPQWLPEQDGRAELAKRLSPLTYVRKELPPILTVQGDRDRTVPTDQGRRLTKALQDAGVDAEMITVTNAGHGFSPQQWPGVREQIFAFLKKRGILSSEGAPPSPLGGERE